MINANQEFECKINEEFEFRIEESSKHDWRVRSFMVCNKITDLFSYLKDRKPKNGEEYIWNIFINTGKIFVGVNYFKLPDNVKVIRCEENSVFFAPFLVNDKDGNYDKFVEDLINQITCIITGINLDNFYVTNSFEVKGLDSTPGFTFKRTIPNDYSGLSCSTEEFSSHTDILNADAALFRAIILFNIALGIKTTINAPDSTAKTIKYNFDIKDIDVN